MSVLQGAFKIMAAGSARSNDCELQKRRKVAVLFIIGFTDLLGVSMIIPLLPKLMFRMYESRSLAGIIGSIYGALQIFSSSTMGKMSDTYGRKSVLLLSYFVSAVAYYLLSVSWSGGMLVLSRIFSGIFKHGLSISKAYIADNTSLEERAAILGYFNAVTSVGFIIGPILAGYLIDYDPSLKLTITTGAVIFSFSFVLVLLFLPSSKKDLEFEAEAPTTNISLFMRQTFIRYLNWNNLRESFKLFHWNNLTEVMFIQFFASFAVLLFRSNLPVFLEENFVISGSRFGQIISFSALATTVFSATCGIVSKYYKNDSVKQMVHFMLLLFVSLSSFAFISNLSYVLIFLAAVSFSTSNLRICMLNLVLQHGRDDEKGAIIGFLTSLTSVPRMLAPTVLGIAQEYGSRTAGLVSASLALVALIGAIGFSVTRASKVEEKETPEFLTESKR